MRLGGKWLRRRLLRKARSEAHADRPRICKWRTTKPLRKKIEQRRPSVSRRDPNGAQLEIISKDLATGFVGCGTGMKKDCQAKNGFTLLELLVVIAIIAVLASLLAAAIGSARDKARQITCINNLRQINFGVRMYSDDANDKTPKPATAVSHPYEAYKALMKSYVGLHGTSSAQDKIFACPADVFYYDYLFGHYPRSTNLVGYVPESLCSRPDYDYSSYAFNAGNLFGTREHPASRPGIAGLPLSSIKHPSRTVLVAEVPALSPFSWHKPKRPLYILSTSFCPNVVFNNAMDMTSFVDGHVSFSKIYWNGTFGAMGVSCNYDPPGAYDYQWSPN